MNTDATIKRNVLEELDWEPSVDATQVGVIVKDGIVTLTGHVNTFAEKEAAENAAKKVYGVRAVVEEIDIKGNTNFVRTDEDIASTALSSLKWNTTVPDNKIKLKVEQGWITLEGQVDWYFQKESAKKAIQNLIGVKGVTNFIQVKSVVEPKNLKEKIKLAFERNATIDADHVDVKVVGKKVILSGSVQSWAEKQQAREVAWAAPGVTEVEDHLQIKVKEHSY